MNANLRPQQIVIDQAVSAVAAMQHELGMFGNGIAQWFEDHPALQGTHPPTIHSVKSRLKDLTNVREKIERKSTSGKRINRKNVFDHLTDLAGVRVIHLYQQQFPLIHTSIVRKIEIQKDWVLHEPPKAYTWDPESVAFFQSLGLACDLKESFYTSVHYVVRPRPDSPLCSEIQVRTLFEEIWGEVDHAINYPSPSEIAHCREQIKVLAKLVGAGSRLVDSIFNSANVLHPFVPSGSPKTNVVRGSRPSASRPALAARSNRRDREKRL
jgi:putative GTP pyrophosphokinase